MRIGLIPLDERPCNEYFPRALGRVADVNVLTPPREMLGNYREVGQFVKLDDWLLEIADDVDGLVVSIETLAYGGLIPSRITDTPVEECLERLQVLRQIKEKHPDLVIYAFNIVMRISNSNINVEEPLYWDKYGKALWLYSHYYYRVHHLGFDEWDELREVESRIPQEVIADYKWRRERNHHVNLAMVDLVADGVIDFLLFTQDDTSEFGFPNQEQHVLREKISQLGVEDRALVYPGADEVGMVLVARHVNRIHNVTPKFFARYSSIRGPLIVANYEDRPIAESVKGQIFGAGGILVDSPQDADIILFLNTPGEKQGEAPHQHIVRTVDTSARNLLEFVQSIKMYHAKGYITAVADLGYSNGADLKLISLLERQLDLVTQLDAYGGWNTAGNTLGTVVAHAMLRYIAREFMNNPELEMAHLEFLLLRFLDDWAYQVIVRTELREKLLPELGIPADDLGSDWPKAQALAGERLQEVMEGFFDRNFAGKVLPSGQEINGFELRDLRLPWYRLFEVGCEVHLETVSHS